MTRPDAPGWVPSLERPSSLRWLRGLLGAVLLAGLAFFLLRGADGPADPFLASGAACEGVGARGGELDNAFGEVAVTITPGGGEAEGVERCLLLADAQELRQRGLMEVTDPALGGYDGMLFAFDEPTTGGFFMRNTRIPLSIAWFDEAGAFVGSADMEPCPDEEPDCPTFTPDAPYVTAIEVPQGRLADLGISRDARLDVISDP